MTDRHEHLDEGTIHAWLDGELSPDESARVEAQAATCTECASLVAEARGLIAASSRILSSLDAVPGGVIPGSDARVDQLAVLRARRSATTRRWWHDRRIVAAASLVFVAGAASVVWRSADQTAAFRTEQTVAAPSAVADSPTPAPSEPASTAPVAVREAPSRDAKVGALAPLRDPRPVRVAKALPGDSAEQKVVDASTSLARGSALAANEARFADSGRIVRNRQALDSISASRIAQNAVPENQARQQGAATQQQRKAFEQARADAQRPAAPPAALGAGGRLGQVVTTGVGARAATVSAAGACYRVRLGTTSDPQVVDDTVRLLDETIPVRSDPSWYQARFIGAVPDTMLMWRLVDSTTVELRSKRPADSLAVRFNTTGVPPSDVRRESGVRGVPAVRVVCP